MPLFVVAVSNGGDKVAYIRMLITDTGQKERNARTKERRRRFALDKGECVGGLGAIRAIRRSPFSRLLWMTEEAKLK
jgi:hypothetical protein